MGRQIWPGLNEYIKNGNIVRPTKYNALFLVGLHISGGKMHAQ